jgi:hypothetical protein
LDFGSTAVQDHAKEQKGIKINCSLCKRREVEGPRTQDIQTKDDISDELDDERRTQNTYLK